MEVLVIDRDPTERAMLLGRLQELKRLPELKALVATPLLPRLIAGHSFASVCAIILGPGLAEATSEVTAALAAKPRLPSASLFVPPAPGTVALPRLDDTALQQFLVQALASSQLARLAEARKVIGVAQLVGGAGATTLVTELGRMLGGELAAGSTSPVALVDLDDVSPSLSVLSKSAPRYRAAVFDAIRRGAVSEQELAEIMAPCPQWGKQLFVVPQPELYAEAFHCKANVIEDAPVASLFVNSLVSTLRGQNSTVVFDLGRSWGLSTCAALARCGQIIFCVPSETPDRVKLSLDFLRRLTRESDSPEEFDLTRWNVALTRVPPEASDAATDMIRASELFNASVPITTIPSPLANPTGYRSALKALYE